MTKTFIIMVVCAIVLFTTTYVGLCYAIPRIVAQYTSYECNDATALVKDECYMTYQPKAVQHE